MRTLKDLVAVENVTVLSQEERTVRISIIELAQWCQNRVAMLERGREVGFQMAVSQQAAEAIEAALPRPDWVRVGANMLRVEAGKVTISTPISGVLPKFGDSPISVDDVPKNVDKAFGMITVQRSFTGSYVLLDENDHEVANCGPSLTGQQRAGQIELACNAHDGLVERIANFEALSDEAVTLMAELREKRDNLIAEKAVAAARIKQLEDALREIQVHSALPIVDRIAAVALEGA